MVDIGDALPDVEVVTMTPDGPQHARTHELLGQGKVVLFGVPGAFTPVCSDLHLPGFVLKAPELRAKGIDTLACVSVNDPFVMAAWAESRKATDDIIMIADPEAEFAAAMGLDADASEFGLGTRSERYAAVLNEGVITELQVEQHFTDHAVSTADAVLTRL